MTLKIQVLAWDRHKNMVGLMWLTCIDKSTISISTMLQNFRKREILQNQTLGPAFEFRLNTFNQQIFPPLELHPLRFRLMQEFVVDRYLWSLKIPQPMKIVLTSLELLTV